MMDTLITALVATRTKLAEKLRGTVRYGCSEHDPTVAIRVNKDETETYSRFDPVSGEFIQFSESEQFEFLRKWGLLQSKYITSADILPFKKK